MTQFQIRPTKMTDAEREAHIADCGRLMQKAYSEGDPAAARRWLEMQYEAIRARTPRQVARMEEERFADCYFAQQGALARRAALLKASQ